MAIYIRVRLRGVIYLARWTRDLVILHITLSLSTATFLLWMQSSTDTIAPLAD